MLSREALEDAEAGKEKIEKAVSVVGSGGREGNLPWFETLVQGSRLANVQRSWGERTARNGRYRVEWEIVEWNAADDSAQRADSPSKRKIGEMSGDEMMA